MKRTIVAVLFLSLCCLMWACGESHQTDDSSFVELEPVEYESETTGIVVDESEKAELLAQLEAGSLDVENDTFEFEKLTSYVGGKESELAALVGAEGHLDGFATKLFGRDVQISTEVNGDTINSIQLLFPDIESELLTNAIGEQLGTDPEESEKVLKWEYLDRVIEQQEVDGGVVVRVRIDVDPNSVLQTSPERLEDVEKIFMRR